MTGFLFLMIIVGTAMFICGVFSKSGNENKRKLIIIGLVLIIAPLFIVAFLVAMFSKYFP